MKTVLGRIFNKIFNRLTITLALIFVQLGYFIVLTYKLADYADWITIGFTVLAVIMARN